MSSLEPLSNDYNLKIINEEVDIIHLLNNRFLDHVTENIFSYLNYEEMKKALMVSCLWNQIIANGKLMWKKIYQINEISKPDWKTMKSLLEKRQSCFLPKNSSYNYFRDMCFKIEESFNEIEKNWSSGSYTELNDILLDSQLLNVSACRNRMQMMGNYVYVLLENCVHQINRWTKAHHAFKAPGKFRNYNVKSFDASEKFFAVTYSWCPGAAIWDVATKKLLHLMDGDEPDMIKPYLNYVRLWDDLLLYNSNKKMHLILSLWKIPEFPTETHKPLTFLHKKGIRGSEMVTSALDKTFVVVQMLYESWDKEIHIIETKTFNHLRTIKLDRLNDACSPLLYLDGIIVTDRTLYSTSENRVRVWDVPTGNCLMELGGCNNNRVQIVKFASKKYLLNGHANTSIDVWELKINDPRSSTLVWKIPRCYSFGLKDPSGSETVADQFQIITFVVECSKWQGTIPLLRILDFVGLYDSLLSEEIPALTISNETRDIVGTL